jgi:CobQ-like glutamine amidotransferase family enzyme
VPFLAIAAGWQLLGRELTTADGLTVAGAGVFPSVASIVPGTRFVGEVSGDSVLGEVAGYENHSAVTVLDEGAVPLARLARGRGSGSTDEGVVVGDRVGTNLHGSFLPMNPHWADRLLDAAIRLAGVQPADQDSRMFDVDSHARRSREAIRARLGLN